MWSATSLYIQLHSHHKRWVLFMSKTYSKMATTNSPWRNRPVSKRQMGLLLEISRGTLGSGLAGCAAHSSLRPTAAQMGELEYLQRPDRGRGARNESSWSCRFLNCAWMGTYSHQSLCTRKSQAGPEHAVSWSREGLRRRISVHTVNSLLSGTSDYPVSGSTVGDHEVQKTVKINSLKLQYEKVKCY